MRRSRRRQPSAKPMPSATTAQPRASSHDGREGMTELSEKSGGAPCGGPESGADALGGGGGASTGGAAAGAGAGVETAAAGFAAAALAA